MYKNIMLLAAASSLLLATGCLGDLRAERIAANEAVINIGGEPRTLDPSLSTDVVSSKAISCFMRGLTSIDANGQVVPEIAESWESDNDGRSWRFKLRAAHWSNGDPVTAADFHHAWTQRMLNPAFGAEYAYQLFYIRGARDYYEQMGEALQNERPPISPGMVFVYALAPDLLQVELEAPAPFFPELVAHHAYFPVNEKVDRADKNWATLPETYVGNGPFKLVRHESNSLIVGERNPHYWNAENVGLDRITLRMIQNESVEQIAFENGEIDGTNTVNRVDLDRLRDRPELHFSPHVATYFINFNCQREIFSDPRVRRALALAIDRHAIVQSVTRAGEPIALGLVPPQLYDQPPAPHFQDASFDEARALLAEAGYPGGQGFPRLRYIFNTLESHLRIAQVLQETWRRELGIDVSIENHEFRVLIDNRRNGSFDLARNGWVADFADPVNFLEIFWSQADNNDSHFSDERFDELLQAARAERDPAQRQLMLQEAEAYLMKQMPAAPIYFYTQPFLSATQLNYRLNPMGQFDAAALRWERP